MKDCHINGMELMGAAYGIRAFGEVVKGKVVMLAVDNTVAFHCIRRWRCARSLRPYLEAVWAACVEMGVRVLQLRLVASEDNQADEASRRVDPSDYQLDPRLHRRVVRWVTGMGGMRPRLDAFASLNNRLHTRFWAATPQPGARGVDALAQDWNGMSLWCNPPFHLLGQVLSKYRSSKGCSLVLVAPEWRRAWWPELQRLAAARFPLPLRRTTFLPGFAGYQRGILAPRWEVAAYWLPPREGG
jgi:hypothetical protein